MQLNETAMKTLSDEPTLLSAFLFSANAQTWGWAEVGGGLKWDDSSEDLSRSAEQRHQCV